MSYQSHKPLLSGGKIQGLFFDYNSTTPLDRDVAQEMSLYLDSCQGNPHSSDHAFGWEATQAIQTARERLSKWVGCDPSEIVFTSGATEANNLAILGAAIAAKGSGRNKIIVGASEHKCVLAAARAARELFGCEIFIAPVDREGFVDADVLANLLDERTLLASLMSANNEIGTIQDLQSIGALCRENGALLHSDAAQLGFMSTTGDFIREADLVSFSAHKIYGPKGIGALMVRHDVRDKLQPIIYGGGQEGGLRSGTLPTQLCVGFGKAAEVTQDFADKGVENTLRVLARNFFNLLQAGPTAVSLNGPDIGKCRHPGNLSLTFDGISAEDFIARLQPRLAVSSGSACTTGIPEPSHVLRAIGLNGDEASATIRVGLGRHTSQEDIELAANILLETLASIGEEEGLSFV